MTIAKGAATSARGFYLAFLSGAFLWLSLPGFAIAAPATPTQISPSNGSTVSGSTVTLVWSAVSGAGAYSVGLRDQTTGILANIPLVTGTSTTQPIVTGHSYKWDVASCTSATGGDNTTNCPNRSGDWFFTASAPPAPTQISPSNGAVLNSSTVTLVWSSVSGAGAYSVGLRDQTTGILASIPLVTGTSTTQPIVAGHSYKWDVASCVSATGGDNTTNCPNRSGDWFFSDQGSPPAPTQISPSNGAVLNSSTVTLVWSSVSGAGAYSVGLRDQTTGILASIPLVTGTSTTQPIVAGHSYKWDVASCVSATGGDNTTNCPNRSGDWFFSDQGSLPAPTQISPSNDAVLNSSTVTLVWSSVSGAGAYSVGLRDETTGILASIPLVTGTSTTQPITSGHNYKWDVASCTSATGGDNTTNCPNRSGDWFFSDQTSLPAPTQISPSNGSTVSGSSVTLVWSSVSGAGAYSVGLRDETTGILASIPLVTGTSTTQPITAGHNYKWDVASCTSATGGDNTTNCPNRSGDWLFSVQQGSGLPAPSLVSPANGATMNGTSVTLVWSSVTGAGAYSVNLRDQNTGITNSTLTTSTSLPQGVVAGHAYKWNVASCSSATGGNNTTNCPNRSSTWAFGVQGTTTAWLWPVKGSDTRNVVSQPYADYDDGKKNYYHTALDIAVANNTEIVSAAPGTVARLIFNESDTSCQTQNGGSGCPDHGDGNTIVIQNTPNAVYSQYQHLADFDTTLQGQVTSTCTQNSKNPLEYDCFNAGPTVTAGQTIGHSGGSGYGSLSYWPYHLHFEVKDFSTIAPPGLKEWGYTSAFPDFDGYFDPMNYVDSTTQITPIRVTITQAGNGVTLRIGPRQNYPAPPFKPSYGYSKQGTVYWARQTAPASTGCSGGWYQIYQGPPEDPQYPPNTFTNYFHETFNENGKVFGMLPSVWVCRGDSGVVWVSP